MREAEGEKQREKKVKKGREEKGERMKERYGKIKGNAGREIRLRN